MRQVFRRRLMLPLALFAVAAVSTGCSTFSDSDSVARVGDVSLSQDDFEATLTELGAIHRSRSMPSSCAARSPPGSRATRRPADRRRRGPRSVRRRLRHERRPLPVGDRRGGRGHRDTVAADLDGGRPFDETFAESNIDQAQTATGGNLECVPRDVVDAAAEQPFIQASVVLDADDPVGTAPLFSADGDEVGWVVVVFRPFDDLADEDIAIVAAAQGSTADVYVDPRYGTFDGATAQVIGLG